MTLSGNSLRQTLHTHCASVHQTAKLVAALLRVAGVTAGLAESSGSLPSGLWFTSPAGWLPRTGIGSGTLRSVIEYGLPLPFYMAMWGCSLPVCVLTDECYVVGWRWPNCRSSPDRFPGAVWLPVQLPAHGHQDSRWRRLLPQERQRGRRAAQPLPVLTALHWRPAQLRCVEYWRGLSVCVSVTLLLLTALHWDLLS